MGSVLSDQQKDRMLMPEPALPEKMTPVSQSRWDEDV